MLNRFQLSSNLLFALLTLLLSLNGFGIARETVGRSQVRRADCWRFTFGCGWGGSDRHAASLQILLRLLSKSILQFRCNTFTFGAGCDRVVLFVDFPNLGFLGLSIDSTEGIEGCCRILNFLRIFKFFVNTLNGLNNCVTLNLRLVLCHLLLCFNF